MLCMCSFSDSFKIGPLHDLVKWYKVTHAVTHVAGDSKQSGTFKTKWDIQNSVGHSKQREVNVDWYELLYFGTPAGQLESRYV